ncbi:unnamed protein product [Mesocestoides corti]|uniref:DH domain-containing protein n=1 Tax=Mesocestoides corti TaxID=53468 RepID=A0A0R3U417_MESCO|nr:unnamed protein product [Mesocestoides corti]
MLYHATEEFRIFLVEPFRFVEDSSTFQPSPVPTAEKPATLGQSGADPELVASTSLSDSHPSNESPQPHTMPSLTPRVHLPQLRMEDRTRRARHDHYFVCPKSPNAFFMGDTGQSSPISVFTTNDKPDLQQRSTQRSKSVSRLPERKFSNHGTFNGSAGVDAVQSNASNGRMYSRSCFRYRSTDIDVALATATASRENLAGSHFGDDSKKKTAASLFDLSAKIQPLTTTNLQSLNGKSTNSLLETDIDTGMQNGQQIILETDVDTLNTYRLVGGFTGSEQGTIQSNQDKAYSLFNLSSYSNSGPTRVHQTDELQHESRADAYKRTQSLSGIAKSGDGQRSDQKAGASGLIARLRARARSNHELRVAESLTRIHVPEWLDKADLSRPISPQRREPSPSPTREKAALPRYGTSLPSTTLLQSTISTSLDAKTKGTKTVETVAKPTWSPAPQKRSDFKRPLRPSQILRERNASSGPRLVPIKSSLRSSMRSQVIGGTNDASIDRGAVIRTSTPGSKRCPVRLDPEDFLTHDEKVWGEKSIPQSLPPVVCTNGASAELVQAPKTTPTVPTSPPIPKPSPRTPSRAGQLVRRNGETHIVDDVSSIKMADSESLIENQFYQSMDNNDGVQYTSRFDDEGIYEEVRRPSKLMPPPLSLPRPSPLTSPTSTITSRSPIHSSTWHHADSDGETETMATDGLDNISDLTCLTDLLDKCSGRHLALLQNRPSALENLLSQLGWWSSTPSAKPRQQLRGSGDFVALAAGRFDPDEDSHRHEFLSLLASPAGQGPMILTEYGFDQKRIGLDRNPKDGMLYLHCSNPSCPRLGPTRVDKARSWRTCTNCFTAYCSTRCREQGTHAHSSVCTFGRARLVCGRILHQLAPSQQSGLTALAKAGTTRLGRGGIVIAFASAQDAEYFLARCAALPLKQQNQQAEPVAADRPSPSGLLAPPIYLTVEEVSKLDSKLAAPCKIYKPSVSYVLIVIVCAYDLEVMKCGRAVHLYKQSIILPFPGATAVDAPRSQLPLLKETTISWTQPQTTKEEREAYSKRLQRTLRERGVSLRNSEPEVYKRLSAFVETGEAFDPVEFDFHDYYSNQVITCTIAPMKDAVIRQKMITRPDERHRNYPYKQNHRPLKPRIGETEL